MKPLPIVAGIAVVVVVLAGFAIFLFATGGEDGRQADSTLQDSVATGQAAKAGASVDAAAGSSGPELAPQDNASPGQQQGDIVVSPVTNRPGGPATGEFVPGIPQQAGEAPQHPWQEDGLTDLEAEVAGFLAEISGISPQVGTALAGVDWLADEMTLEEGIAVPLFRDMAATDPDLALMIVTLPWVDDYQLEEDELMVLFQLGEIASAQPELARSLAGSLLLAGEITLSQEVTIAIVQGVAVEDPELAQRMAESPELSDGIDAKEMTAFTGNESYFLEQIERYSPATADVLERYAWVSDLTSRYLEPNGHSSPGVLASPPLQSDASGLYGQSSLRFIVELARLDPALSERVAAYPWVADKVTDLEVRVLWTLFYLAHNDLEVTHGLTSLPWMEAQPNKDHLVANRLLLKLTRRLPAYADTLINQPWYQDSISDEEGALLQVMSLGCNYESFCQQLLNDGQVESRVLSRPTRDVKVFAISRSPLGSEAEFIFEGTQLTIDGMEELIGPNWPESKVVVYLEPEFEYVSKHRGLGGSFVMISDSHPGRTESWDVLFHELAHYYRYGTSAKWVVEGVTSFFDSYVFYTAGVGTIKYRYDRTQQAMEIACVGDGQSNIYERIQATKDWSYSEWLWNRACDYYLGERLMHAFYMDLGHDMVAGSVQALHRGPDGRLRLSEKEIYDIFLSHTPPENASCSGTCTHAFMGCP